MALKDLFIKSEGTVESQPTQASQQTIQMETTTFVGNPSTMQQSNVVQTNEVNDNIVKKLWQVLIDKNLPGPDYLEVKNSAAALQAMNLPVDKCYEAAFRTLQASYPNFTKDVLLASIDTYIKLILQEQEDGKKECDAKRQKQVGEKMTRISQLNEHKNELARQIAELQSQVEETNTSITQLEAEVRQATDEINKGEALFNNSIENVVETLNSDKAIMEKLTI